MYILFNIKCSKVLKLEYFSKKLLNFAQPFKNQMGVQYHDLKVLVFLTNESLLKELIKECSRKIFGTFGKQQY